MPSKALGKRCSIVNYLITVPVRTWQLLLAVTLLMLVLVSTSVLRLHFIMGSMPYPGHIDEPGLANLAARILKTGDPNPHNFYYPSLPIYLTTAAFAFGHYQVGQRIGIDKLSEMGSVSFPYYSYPQIVWPARTLFALLSVAAMALLGVATSRAYSSVTLLFLVPLLLGMSSTYFSLSQQYLNVDIVGAFFVALLYACLFGFLRRDTYLLKSILPGLVSGLAVGSKYNLAWVLLPPLLAIWLFTQEQRLPKTTVLLLATGAAFLLVVPYSLLDFNTFLAHVVYEVNHYRSGHPGFEGMPGWGQLGHYLRMIMMDYGRWNWWLVLLGVVKGWHKDRRETIIFLSFPLALLLYMSTQRVNFVRNILTVYMFYACFAALGMIGVYVSVGKLVGRIRLLSSRSTMGRAIGLLSIIIVLGLFPVSRLFAWSIAPPDTRNTALVWIQRNLQPGAKTVVAQELSMDVTALERQYVVQTWSFHALDEATFCKQVSELGGIYVLLPIFGYDKRDPVGLAIF